MCSSNIHSRSIRKKPKNEIKKECRQILSKAKSSIENHFATQDSQLVYGDRLSYSKYQKIRIAESYQPKVGNHSSEKRHGFAKNNYPFDEEWLLTEAKTWSPEAKINWTKLGTDMQLTSANRGQVVKELKMVSLQP